MSSQYKETQAPVLTKTYNCSVSVTELEDVYGCVSGEEAAKRMVSNQGQHKGSLMQTKYDNVSKS